METKIKQIRKTSDDRNTYINNERRYNSPMLLNKKNIKCFFISENILKTEKRNNNIINNNYKSIKKAKSSQNNNIKHYQDKRKLDEININTQKIYQKKYKRENSNSNKNINNKIIFQPNTSKKVVKYKLIRNIYTKEQRKTTTNPINNISNINKIINTSESSINKKKNFIRRINLKEIENKKDNKSNYKFILNKYNKNYQSKISYSLDNILTKTIVNKNKKKLKQNSFDNKNHKRNKIMINISPKIKLKYMENRLNSNILSPSDNNKIKNINSIRNKKLNNINIKNNNRINKPKEIYNSIYALDIGQEKNEKINGVKINNFDVKKPQEQNLKYTFIKDKEKDEPKDISDLSVSHASKVIIGKIDGYKDIIENDKRNNKNKFNPNLYMKNNFSKDISDSLNFSNNLDAMSSTNTNKKNNFDYNNDSNYLKSEKKIKNNKNKSINSISISFSINTEKSVNDFSKIINYNVINIDEDFEKKEKIRQQNNNINNDNCVIF